MGNCANTKETFFERDDDFTIATFPTSLYVKMYQRVSSSRNYVKKAINPVDFFFLAYQESKQATVQRNFVFLCSRKPVDQSESFFLNSDWSTVFFIFLVTSINIIPNRLHTTAGDFNQL